MNKIIHEIENVFKAYYVMNTPSDIAEQNFNYYTTAGRRKCEEGYIVNSRGLKYSIILVTTSGMGKIITENQTHILNTGTFCFLMPDTIFTIYPIGNNGWDFYWIDAYGAGISSLFNVMRLKYKNISTLTSPALIVEMIEKLINCDYTNIALREYYISDLLYSIVNSVLFSQISEQFISNKSENIVSEICMLINNEPACDLNIKQLSRKYFISENQLIRIFKKVTGNTPYEYIIKTRLSHACHYLSRENYSVSEVSRLTGFKSITSFSRQFYNKFGITPSQYKKHINISI